MRSLRLKSLSISVLTAFGLLGAGLVPASAHYTTTHCDRDGDDCYTVRCDDDGDDCHRIASYPRYDYNRHWYYGNHSSAYSDWSGYGAHYDSGRYNHYNNDYYNNNDYYGRFGRNNYDDDDE